jgi:hypothetical protein
MNEWMDGWMEQWSKDFCFGMCTEEQRAYSRGTESRHFALIIYISPREEYATLLLSLFPFSFSL